MTFSGANTYHHNGIAERRIRKLQDQASAMLTQASSRWPKCVSTDSWTYAINTAQESINVFPSMQDKFRRSPL